ncbi:MAG: protein kinase [Cyanobacteria bacterium]|nr:protein kinase [Cyanobacteria bacterium CG_2015-16_32_12]NCO78361.1 protein kinase [Cyanobacteria bacterium CG_2015-22_32_23]NCQ05338.1 protein kinase [Cyanobacteria bacterium CG_2015-09_32_10]NCQ41219.1 protein kinase [Cyanobacteria bacterium CG_2015-04_32_10]NCS84119.1 protein kinase [Cyanobacteria bacterium CG_2015-02_32_10]
MFGIFGGDDRNKKNNKAKTKDLATVDKGYRLADKYEIIKKLGEGGFGAAFLVKSLTANVVVNYVAKAQKLTDNPAQNEDLITRFKRESNTLQKLGNAHGQIPSLFDFFEFEGNFYLIQEYVKGQTLSDVLIAKLQKKNTFSPQEAIEITLSLLEVLIKVHDENVIHRDIKPQNIILREGDNKPVLIDFGLIKESNRHSSRNNGILPIRTNVWQSHVSE